MSNCGGRLPGADCFLAFGWEIDIGVRFQQVADAVGRKLEPIGL